MACRAALSLSVLCGSCAGFEEVVLASEWLYSVSRDWPKHQAPHLVVPSVLDCTYDEGWDRFRRSLQRNAAEGWHYDNDVFDQADRLIAQNLLPFMAFHRSKSNEFFHDCDRAVPTGRICLYGMLSALFIHHVYLRTKFESGVITSEGDEVVYRDSTNVARLMLINKNNCMDFFDSSSWPLTLERLIHILLPPGVEPVEPPTDPPGRAYILSQPAPAFHLLAHSRAWKDGFGGRKIVVYITGTHAALGREPAEMMQRFAGPLLGCEVVPVLEIADTTHCQFVGCDASTEGQQSERSGESGQSDSGGAGGAGLGPVRIGDVGLSALAEIHFRPRWLGTDIVDLPLMRQRFVSAFVAHPLSREADVLVCTSPAILCTFLLPFSKPMVAYLGEPMLLSVPEEEVEEWWGAFDAMATEPGSYFACYNPFLAEMIRYQTGLQLPVIRVHGLYTRAAYTGASSREVLIVKGPNICLDPVCLLNRFAAGLPDGDSIWKRDHTSPETVKEQCGSGRNDLSFVGLDELRGAAYSKISSFLAVVVYPYDVALALFYELYSMGVPMLLPRPELLRFFVFRGLHSGADYHHVRPGLVPGDGPAPFLPPMDQDQWFRTSQYWSSWTDFVGFPHLMRFGTAAEILAAFEPGATDWGAVSGKMRRFNEDQLAVSATQWAAAIAGAAGVAAGAHGPEVPPAAARRVSARRER